MAGKQLGKLRQWAGEVISSRDKTTVSDEFKELERDVELRKDGAQRLFLASEAYHRNLAKKKDAGALDDAEKLLPVDTLGIVMIIHGEEFGPDSAFGTSLVTLGRAHCKVAKLQETFAQSFHDNFMGSLVRFADDIKDYEALRKKLESRRLSLDAAVAKHDKLKNNKKDSKERERRDAEEEMQRAKARYDETEEEVEAHMHAIQENEVAQLRELTALLTLQMGFVEQYLDVLKDTRANWPSDSPAPKHTAFPTQKFGSTRSKKSIPTPRASESSEDEGPSRPASRPPSRPGSRSSTRKRADSTGTAGGERDRRRLSVAGWAAGAVGSVTGRGKKTRDKETFASLGDDADDAQRDSGNGESDNGSGGGVGLVHALTRRASSKSNGVSNGTSSGGGKQTTPKLPARILKPPSQAQRKVVRALYDFSGSSDELAFKAGDQIVVVNEVLDGWWMGELNGKQGLFPTPYTEVLPERPPLPSRPGASNHLGLEMDSDGDSREDDDDDDDAHEHYGRPLAAASNNSPFYGGLGDPDAASIVSSVDDDERTLVRPVPARPTPPRRATTSDLGSMGAQGKKAPPPPPPRRGTSSVTASPLIPERRPPSRGSPAPRPGYASATSSESSHTQSPFESAAEGGCGDFKQNPFKPKGMCSNCFEFHSG